MALFLASVGMSWDQALADFAKYQRGANLADKTIVNRESCLRHLARLSGKLPLEVDKSDLQSMLGRMNERTGHRLAQGTMQSERSYLQCFFAWLKEEGYTSDDPAERLKPVKMTRRRPRPLRYEQVEAMLDSGAYTRTRDIITICALTGLRIGEVVKIRGEDVDRAGMVIACVRKGALEHRLPVPEGLREIVERYPTAGWWFPSPYSNRQFPNGGGHILMASASDAVSKAIRRAGITDRNLTGHSLRHYLATTLLKQGVHIRVVQELLGHASLATTQIYAGVDEEDMSDGINQAPIIPLRAHSGRRARIAA